MKSLFTECIRQLQSVIERVQWYVLREFVDRKRENNILYIKSVCVCVSFFCTNLSKCLNLCLLYHWDPIIEIIQSENVFPLISLVSNWDLMYTAVVGMPAYSAPRFLSDLEYVFVDPLRSSNLLWPLQGRGEWFLQWRKTYVKGNFEGNPK